MSTLVSINSLLPIYSQLNKCNGSCNIIDNLYAWIRVSNKVKNKNVKVFNLMSEVN